MDMMKFLKILFLWNPWSDLKKKIPKCSLGDPFENLFVNFDPSRNMALVDGGYLLLYRNEEFLKILPFETDGQISKWTLEVTFWKLLSKIINLVSIPQKKKKKKKKIGYGYLKNSGERSRAILALLFYKTMTKQTVYLDLDCNFWGSLPYKLTTVGQVWWPLQ